MTDPVWKITVQQRLSISSDHASAFSSAFMAVRRAALQPGAVELTGQAYAPASPAEAIRAGVVTVHQNINDGVVAGLDVATNLTLDRLSGSGARFISIRAACVAKRARSPSAWGFAST